MRFFILLFIILTLLQSALNWGISFVVAELLAFTGNLIGTNQKSLINKFRIDVYSIKENRK